MDIEKVKILIEAIDTGSITVAAENLGYTPSGISRAIASLEAETNLILLNRGKHGVTPNDNCKKLLPTFRNILSQNDILHMQVAEINGLYSGNIVIGTAYSAYYIQLLQVIKAFTEEYPGITVQIIEGTSSNLCNAIENDEADLCIVSKRKGNFNWTSLINDELVACVPQNHPCIEKGSYPIKRFETDSFVEIYPGLETDNSLFFINKGIHPNVKYKTYDDQAAYSMVEAGLGVMLANSLLAERRKESFKILPLNPHQIIEIGVATPKTSNPSPASKKFAEFAYKYFVQKNF